MDRLLSCAMDTVRSLDPRDYNPRDAGQFRGFDWESAILYSEAEATDSSNAVNLTDPTSAELAALGRSFALSR